MRLAHPHLPCAAALAFALATEPSHACSCAEPHAVVAAPWAVSRLPASGPIVIHASGTDAIVELRDEAHEPVPLRALWRSPTPPKLCSDWWWVLAPESELQPGHRYSISLQAFREDDQTDATKLSTRAAENLAEEAARVAYEVRWEDSAPKPVDPGFCYDKTVAGKTAAGAVTVLVSVEPAVPLFLELKLEPAELGALHDVGSTLVRDGEAKNPPWRVSGEARASVLLFDGSDPCVTIRLRDVHGAELETAEWCRGSPTRWTSEHSFTTWRAPPQTEDAGCSLVAGRRRSTPGTVFWLALALAAVRWAQITRASARSCSSHARPGP